MILGDPCESKGCDPQVEKPCVGGHAPWQGRRGVGSSRNLILWLGPRSVPEMYRGFFRFVRFPFQESQGARIGTRMGKFPSLSWNKALPCFCWGEYSTYALLSSFIHLPVMTLERSFSQIHLENVVVFSHLKQVSRPALSGSFTPAAGDWSRSLLQRSHQFTAPAVTSPSKQILGRPVGFSCPSRVWGGGSFSWKLSSVLGSKKVIATTWISKLVSKLFTSWSWNYKSVSFTFPNIFVIITPIFQMKVC